MQFPRFFPEVQFFFSLSLYMSKISIQNDRGEIIVGILEKKEAIDLGRTRPRLVLITHGVLGKEGIE